MGHRELHNRNRAIIEVRVCVDVWNLVELIDRSMQRVRSGLRDLVDHAADGMSFARVRIKRPNRNFLHRVLRRRISQRTQQRQIGRAVQQHFAHLVRRSAHRPRVSRAVIKRMHQLRRRRRDHTFRKLGQRSRRTAIQRQVSNRLRRNNLSDRSIRLVYQRRRTGHSHRLRRIAHLHRHIHQRVSLRLQAHRAMHRGLEPRHGHRNRVVTRQQERHDILSIRIALGLRRGPGVDLFHRHARPRNDCSGRVCYCSTDRPTKLLGHCHPCK